MAHGDLRNKRHESALLRVRVVELRDQGLSFRDIATEVNRDVHTVWDHYQTAMRAIPAAAVAQHQENAARRLDEQLRRIDMEREAVMEVLTARHLTISNGHIIAEIIGRDDDGKPIYGEPILDDAPVLTAVDRLVKLDDQEAKLLGLYPKTQISVRQEPTETDKAIQELLRELDARNNVEKTKIQRAANN